MIIELLSNATEAHEYFVERFLLTYDEYIAVHSATVENYAKMGKVFDEDMFRKMFMWDRLKGDFKRISQTAALDILKGIDGNVLFISEGDDFDSSCHLRLNGQLHKGFLARGNAKDLAELIEYEWRESWKSAMQDQYFDTSLPEDLYVFDPSMEWLLVFTHEGDGAAMEEQAQSRWCYFTGKI